MHMRVKPPRQTHARAEHLAAIPGEAFFSKLQPGIHELDVGPLAESVVNDGFVLVDGDRTGGIDEVSTGFGFGADAVDGTEDQLLLEVGEEGEVSVGLLF